ncbi:hypothetical protein [Pseudofrankia asymbiotica]|uniref:Uncharacterized protein n=1 Tax=Pseudofrankia asymbiotica TaxID=1834516 RepID=A0A1V2I2E2_9ACTN|nr:hypothetical protein [Pseudofrankia asymbiotica]ONH24344.1 hypothetical protein BL253_30430 [Pseudofrankia asymbiotica]
MGEFEKAIAAEVDDAGAWTAEVAEGWDIDGHPHGGYDSSDRLVAQGRQLAGYRGKPQQPPAA